MSEEQYRDRVRKELLQVRTDTDTGFRDQFGFIVDYNGGKPDTEGEGTLHTGVAVVALATGNFHQDAWETANANQYLQQLLETLRDRGWGNQDGLGRKHPIRHPNVFDYNSAGTAFRNSPLTKDGFGPIIAASLYAYKCPHSSDAVRGDATSLIQKWIEYLVFSQWRTHSNYIAGEFEPSNADGEIGTDSEHTKYYKNIFNNEGKRVKFKGPEAFLLLPHEIYALQNVGAALGQETSTWDVWKGGMLPELKQTITDLVAPYIGDACKRAISAILDKLKIAIPYSISLGAEGWNFGKLEGVFAVGIPSDVRMAIATSFGDAVRDIIREFVRLDNLAKGQTDQLLDLAVSRILDLLPNWLGADKWRAILTLALRQISPWLDGSIWLEAITYAGTLQLLKKLGVDIQSYSLWSYAVTFETRPELASLLRPIVQEFFSALRGQGNPVGMWAWLAEDSGRVNEQLETFVSAPSPYHWDKFAYGSEAYGDWVADVVTPPEEIGDKPNPANKQSPRLDYLVLQGLEEMGPPRGLPDVAQDWFDKFRDAVKDLFDNFLANAKQLIEHLGMVALDGLSKVDFHVDSPAIPPVHIHGDAGHGDAHGDVGHGDVHADAGHGDAHGDAGHGDVHGDTVHGDFHEDAGHWDQHLDIPSPTNFHSDFHTDTWAMKYHEDRHGDNRIEAHGDQSLGGAHGDSAIVRVHGDAGPLGVHGDSPAVGLHGDSPSVGVHGDSPSVGVHGDTPPVGHLDAHGDVGNGGHLDSPIIPPIKITSSTPHGDAHGDAGHGDAHSDIGHGDAHGDAGHGDIHADAGHGDAHADVGHGDAHGDLGHGLGGPHADWGGAGIHGDSGGIGLHGDSPGVGLHGDSPSLGLHGDSPSVGVHGDCPANELHADMPGLGHGDVHIDRADTRDGLEPSATHTDAPLAGIPGSIHVDTHADAPEAVHQDSHSDTTFGNIPPVLLSHVDSHADTNGPHQHSDSHSDSVRYDRSTMHIDMHADTGHPEHGDSHLDTTLTGPTQSHFDVHVDAIGPPHADAHGDAV
jgi:hypothetical protein